MMNNGLNMIVKYSSAALGGLLAYLEPTVDYLLICLLAILFDCFTAWQLDRRVKRKYAAELLNVKAYFSSRKMSKIFRTMLEIFGVVVLSFLIDKYIFTFAELYLANIVSGVFCMCQIWSVLENVSSENDSTWARLLQKIMVNKVARHLDIDITETDFKPKKKTKRTKKTDNE